MVSATASTITAPAPNPASGTTGGGIVLAGASGQPSIKLQNTGSGSLQVSVNTVAAPTTWTTQATLDATGNLTLAGGLVASFIKKLGYELLPIGCIMKWNGSVASIPGGWSLCNGTNGTPNLTGYFVLHADGATFLPGQTGGSATGAGTTSTAPGHSHTGLTGSGGSAALTGYTDTQGSHSHTGNTNGHSLSIGELPAHDHNLQGAAVLVSTPSGSFLGNAGSGSTQINYLQEQSQGSGSAHAHPISADGAHAHNLNISAVPAHQHSISTDGSHTHTVTVPTIPPLYALCYIMKTS
jgi:hypothetical protein